MNTPLVSICVISYNHEKFIRQALESVAAQKINFTTELIIAEDKSKDNTRSIIEEFISSYQGNVKFLKREKNIGPAANFLDMIAAASGKYVAYLEGDDYWAQPYKLQRQVDFLEAHSDLSMSSHNSTVLSPKGEKYPFNKEKKYSEKPYDTIYSIDDYIVKDFFHSSSIVYRRSMLPTFPKWYPNAFGGDYFLVLLLAMHGGIHYINEPLSVYRNNTDSVSYYSSRVEINSNFNEHLLKFNEYSGKKYDRLIKEKIFSLNFGFYYYHPSYFKKLRFFLKNIGNVFRMDKTAFPPAHRLRIFVPSFLLRSKVNIFEKKAK